MANILSSTVAAKFGMKRVAERAHVAAYAGGKSNLIRSKGMGIKWGKTRQGKSYLIRPRHATLVEVHTVGFSLRTAPSFPWFTSP